MQQLFLTLPAKPVVKGHPGAVAYCGKNQRRDRAATKRERCSQRRFGANRNNGRGQKSKNS